ncbi:MAG: Ribose-5-phosphate isomerase [Candidatus Beckwithbacteria bacterium GW2011_GWA2_43_10]|uniref:Ribose-5-phosphate isomerase n=1 Tax=Candidatus Beckwithbacteria bacterium GW2011_GWA2_43_10 TaxID=1618369 RepID=A0A0G1E7D2_9BACT|nr:MAG: Ribose-5-phosphate isomerase [Candidatus Beckwithbacteria bacterium GW2011_GWA2_43_10]
MKVYLGADHRGFKLKEKIKAWLKERKINFEDKGAYQYDKNDDYPDFGSQVGQKVSEAGGKGIVVCGSGVGISLAAGKFKGVRAMIGFNVSQVKHGVEFDHANVLSLPADHINLKLAKKMVKVFLETNRGRQVRNLRRVNKIKQIEERNFVC